MTIESDRVKIRIRFFLIKLKTKKQIVILKYNSKS